jgi:hypothetical protein
VTASPRHPTIFDTVRPQTLAEPWFDHWGQLGSDLVIGPIERRLTNHAYGSATSWRIVTADGSEV